MDGLKLEIRGLSKVYPGTVALKDFSATLEGGKVYALVGKNGSGKSTLVKCVAGAVNPSAGELHLNGVRRRFRSPIDAFRSGVALVYQELSLILDFSVAENILIGRHSMKGPWNSIIDWEGTKARAAEILKTLRIDIPVDAKVSSLSLGQRQMIEIAKAMSYDPSVLILDEPTSALAQHEIESLFKVIRHSRDLGVIVVFITHKLGEIQDIADEVIVLRDSELIGSVPIADARPQRILEMMFGGTEILGRPADLPVSAEAALEVSGLSRSGKFADVSFTLHKGEILGIAGMLGSGRSELLRSIFGADPIDSGELRLGGRKVTRPDIPGMKALGLAMTPENRKEEGLVQILSIRDNLCFASLESIARGGILSRKRQEPVVRRWINELKIKTGSAEAPVSSLSGGNQQKVVVGNWLNTQPSIVIFDEPTRGIDVQAKQQVFQIMWDLSRKGLSVVFVSTELEELLEVCHRILIMKRGRIEGEARPENTSISELYALCMEAS